MPYQPPAAEQTILAKLPPNASISLEKLRSGCRGFSAGQLAFVRMYGGRFTASELAILFQRRHWGIATLCARLRIKLKPQEPIRKPKPNTPPRAPLLLGARSSLGHNNGTGIGSTSRPKRVHAMYQMPESLRRYQPERADLEAGWFVNTWILHKMGLRQLGPDGCSWIDGDPREPDWSFCGKPRVRGGGRAYCEEHIKRVYQAKPKQETEDGGDQQEANCGASAGIDDKARVQQDVAGVERRTRRGGRSGDECRVGVQKAQKAGHKSRSYSFGAKTKGAR